MGRIWRLRVAAATCPLGIGPARANGARPKPDAQRERGGDGGRMLSFGTVGHPQASKSNSSVSYLCPNGDVDLDFAQSCAWYPSCALDLFFFSPG